MVLFLLKKFCKLILKISTYEKMFLMLLYNGQNKMSPPNQLH